MKDKIKLPTLPLKGGCQCGAVRYSHSGAPVVFYICHCTECQKQSSSAFGQSLRVHIADLAVTGALDTYERSTASGATVMCEFCPRCGSRLFHRRDKYAENLNIKAGSLDDTSWLKPAGHIWTDSKQSWVQIGIDELAFRQQPPDRDTALIERWREMTRTDI